MKTFIHIRKSDKAVVGVGILHPDIIAAGDDAILAEGKKSCPPDCDVRVVDAADLPGPTSDGYDKTFFRVDTGNGTIEGWTDANPGPQVDVHLPTAKQIAHHVRRQMREQEFEPLDKRVTYDPTAEKERQKVRDKYAKMQTDIDNAAHEDELKTILGVK